MSLATQIAIVLCIFKAEEYIADQLESIRQQTWRRWTLFVSDDGCCDRTFEHIRKFESRLGQEQRLVLRSGPRQGATRNFLSTLFAAGGEFDAYAYCDQDDVWDPDRLEKGVKFLAGVPAGRPALWCSRTRLIGADGQLIGLSPLFARPPGFSNALVQNIGGGNTMLFNRAACDVLVAAGDVDVVAHDWWTYKLVTGVGGIVHYDPQPSICYRQHGENLVGANVGALAALRRMSFFASRRFAAWTAQDQRALERCAHLLLPENRALIETFGRLRDGRLVARLQALREGQFYRQTTRGQCGLIAGAVMGWI